MTNQPPVTIAPMAAPASRLSALRRNAGWARAKAMRSAAEQHRQRDAHQARVVRPEPCREQRREPLVVEPVVFEGDAGRFEDGDAQQPQQAAQRRVRGDAEHQQHHQGLEAAAAEAHQVALPAARREGHADAEGEAPDDVAEPAEVRGEVDRVREIDEAGGVQRLGAEDGEAGGEAPRAEASERAHVQHVAHRPHGAEVGLVGDEAEDGGQDEAPGGHVVHDGELEILHVEPPGGRAGRDRPQATAVRRAIYRRGRTCQRGRGRAGNFR